MRSKAKIIVMWLAGIVLAVLPLVFDYAHRAFGSAPSWLLTIIHGELILIAVAILADVLVRVLASDDSWGIRLPLGLVSLVVFGFLVYMVGEIRPRTEDVQAALSDSRLVWIVKNNSWWGFLSSVVIGFVATISLED
jgi:hypothetical protein